MKRTEPVPLDISSDEDDKPSASNGTKDPAGGKRLKTDTAVIVSDKKVVVTEELMIRSAKMYQEYMKQIPIPAQRGSVITFTSWSGLAKSMKQLYQQPLHYLTNVRVKEWDQLRGDADIRAEPLDTIIHPCKAETNIWLMEEVHRLTSSYQFLAKLWLADPMYNASIDSVFPQL
uniref:protein RDM1-like n=1 Tax=Erigeron canadensis TaxID=72917 RepID=UPI001CB8E37F|nr:protein RDM1-like [Erigeron canadensis]XP_043612886.1 protein RDM1-like [Erigeron canadensis]